MSKPVVLLDVDGVVNIFRTSGTQLWTECEVAYVEHTGDRNKRPGYTVHIAKQTIKFLNALKDSDLVHVIWLTTWVHNAQRLTDLGIPEFPYLKRPEGADGEDGFMGWWKTAVAKELVARLEDKVPVLWIDDEHSYQRPDALHWALTSNRRIELLNPNPYVGLNTDYYTKISDWVERHTGNRIPGY